MKYIERFKSYKCSAHAKKLFYKLIANDGELQMSYRAIGDFISPNLRTDAIKKNLGARIIDELLELKVLTVKQTFNNKVKMPTILILNRNLKSWKRISQKSLKDNSQ